MTSSAHVVNLENGAESAIGSDVLSRALLISTSLAMLEGKSDEKSLVHWLLTVGHTLECHLLIVDLLILGHISLVAEVVEVASVGLGIELWHEWRTLRAECLPVDLGKVLVSVDLLNIRESLTLRGNETDYVSFGSLSREYYKLTW